MLRQVQLVNNEVYHIVSRSIAGYKIFNNPSDYARYISVLAFYQKALPYKFSIFNRLSLEGQQEVLNSSRGRLDRSGVIIIAYCVMPTHIHLLLKQIGEGGISRFVGNGLNSYSRYFNTKYSRKGPLWESKFKNILVNRDEQLLHLTRYIHLNPSSARIVERPMDWEFSSYREYTSDVKNKMCQFGDVLDVDHGSYRKFVNNHIAYQRELSDIKHLLLEDYTS